MPLDATSTSTFGTKYCVYCQDQVSGELRTYEQVLAGSIDAAIRLMGKTHDEAEQMAKMMLPKLPRWSTLKT